MIKFDGEASAQTACLLNNALVDSTHITIKALPSAPEAGTTPSPRPSATGSSPKAAAVGFFSSVFEVGKQLADQVAQSAKDLDEKYQVSGTVTHAAQTAWTATVDTASAVDEKLKISETTSKLYEDVKTKVSPVLGTSSPTNNAANEDVRPPSDA